LPHHRFEVAAALPMVAMAWGQQASLGVSSSGFFSTVFWYFLPNH
jgi:hypothetical protein